MDFTQVYGGDPVSINTPLYEDEAFRMLLTNGF